MPRKDDLPHFAGLRVAIDESSTGEKVAMFFLKVIAVIMALSMAYCGLTVVRIIYHIYATGN